MNQREGCSSQRQATASIPTTTLRALNRALGRTIVTRYGTKRGAIAFGRLLCFVGAEWPLFDSHQFEMDGVFISSPAELVLKILEPGTLTADTIQMIAVELSAKLPPAALSVPR